MDQPVGCADCESHNGSDLGFGDLRALSSYQAKKVLSKNICRRRFNADANEDRITTKTRGMSNDTDNSLGTLGVKRFHRGGLQPDHSLCDRQIASIRAALFEGSTQSETHKTKNDTVDTKPREQSAQRQPRNTPFPLLPWRTRNSRVVASHEKNGLERRSSISMSSVAPRH